jgi:hypothetical protein
MPLFAVVLLALGACSVAPRGPDQCLVTGDQSRADAALARSACSTARERFARILGDPPPGTITLSGTEGITGYTEGARWSLIWPTSARLASGMRPAASGPMTTEARRFVDEQWREVLPHEIGHVMFGAWLYSPGRPMGGEYATYMPDWVDEAIAIAMEPDAVRSDRLAQARSFSPLPSLGEVVAFRHPLRGNRDEAFSTRVVSSPPCDGPCHRERPTETRTITERVFRDGRVTVDTVYAAGIQRLDDDPLARFYVLSYALWSYVESRGGRNAITTLMSRLRRNPRDTAALAGLPGLPATLAAVDADWRAWMTATRGQ